MCPNKDAQTNEHRRVRNIMSDFAVVNPATGETVRDYPTITDAQLATAIGRADEAHRGWARGTAVGERAAMIGRVGDLHAARREQLAAIIVREMRKPREQALGEIDFSGDISAYYADNAETLMAD